MEIKIRKVMNGYLVSFVGDDYIFEEWDEVINFIKSKEEIMGR